MKWYKIYLYTQLINLKSNILRILKKLSCRVAWTNLIVKKKDEKFHYLMNS